MSISNCTSLDKAVQTNEEDFVDTFVDTESDTSSTSSDDSFFLSEKECIELSHTIYGLIEDYVNDFVLSMAKPSFMTDLTDEISHIVFQQLTDADVLKESNYDSLYMFISEQCNEWFLSKSQWNCPIRHLPHQKDNILITEYSQDEEFAMKYTTDKLYEIRNKDEENPEQRTPEWYLRRYNMLTASNAWQALNTDAQYNRLIYEKCKPLETHYIENKWISTQGSLHWGVKYEPLTVMVYEHLTDTRIGNFGCIQHSEHPFLGASPDGIVMNIESPLYGRLVEIKNIFNREMDGIPSEAYWVQTQLQMHCCDLDSCDFVETRFKEYETSEAFWEESEKQEESIEDDSEDGDNNKNKDKLRGIIIEFVARDSTSNIPLYKYSPFCLSQIIMNEWIEQMKSEVAEKHILFKTHYWYLDDIAMTTILKNDAWFEAALPKFKELWNTIERERISGYEHRAPKKRVPKDVLVIGEKAKPTGAVCLIKLEPNELHHY